MKSKKIILSLTFLVFVSVFILLSSTSIAQDKGEDIIAGKKVTIFSKILNEERPILISLPIGYEQSKKRYPVVYITDGSEDKLLGSAGLVHYFGYYEIPEMITVFIPNTDRGRDLSMYPLEQLPKSGGAENFMKFITEELIMFIDENYRTTDYRILVGYSAGGEFVFYTLLCKSEYFDAYIAASLCVFNEKEFLDRTKKFFQSNKLLKKFLFIPYYENDFTIATLVIPKIEKIIKENLPKDFRYQIKTYEGQAHIPTMSLYDGLLSLFHGWKHVKVPEITPSNGLLQEGKSIKVEIKGYDSSIRYTLDGTEPTRESILYTGPITISQPAALKAKSFRSNLSESDAVTAEFKYEPMLSAEKNITNPQAGLNYRYYETRWFILPDSISLEPTRQGFIEKFDINIRTKEQGFLFQFDGYINITKEGQYRFYLLSTVRCKLFLGNTMVINNPCSKSTADPLYNYEEYSYEAYLNPGYYPIKVLYTNPWLNGHDFIVSYEGPSIEKQEIPAEVLFHKNQ